MKPTTSYLPILELDSFQRSPGLKASKKMFSFWCFQCSGLQFTQEAAHPCNETRGSLTQNNSIWEHKPVADNRSWRQVPTTQFQSQQAYGPAFQSDFTFTSRFLNHNANTVVDISPAWCMQKPENCFIFQQITQLYTSPQLNHNKSSQTSLCFNGKD